MFRDKFSTLVFYGESIESFSTFVYKLKYRIKHTITVSLLCQN